MDHPKIEVVDFGSNCRLRVCFLHLICFWFYVYPSLVFRAYYHWQICLLIWLLSSIFTLYIFSFFSFFVSVYMYASFCDIVCIALLLPFVLGFCLFFFFFSFCFFSTVFSACYHCWMCLLVWLLSSFFSFLNYFSIILILIFLF